MAKSDLSGVYWASAGDNYVLRLVTAGLLFDDCLRSNRSKLLVSQHREAVAFGAPHRGPTRHAGAATSLASLWQCAQHRAASDLSVSSSLHKIPSNMHVFRPVQGYAGMLGMSRLPLIAPRRSDGFCPTRCRSLMPSIIIRRGQSVQ